MAVMRQVAGRDDVRDVAPNGRPTLPRLGQVEFEEAAVPAVEHDERVDRLDDARAGGPAAARRRRPGETTATSPASEGRLAAGHGLGGVGLAGPASGRRRSTSRMSVSIGRRLREQADPAALEVVAELLVLDGSKPFSRRIRSASRSQPAAAGRRPPRVTGKRLLIIVRKTRSSSPVVAATVGEVVDVGLAQGVDVSADPRRSSGGPGACSSGPASIASSPVRSSAKVPRGLIAKS